MFANNAEITSDIMTHYTQQVVAFFHIININDN